MDYKKQHFVTAGYLEAWCDPNTPPGYTPYVWIISKKTQKVENKAPKNIFNETDFYTTYDQNENRIVELEKKLQKIETGFLAVRQNIISHSISLTDKDFHTICLFIATMFARVKFQQDQQKEMWQELLIEFENLPKVTQDLLKKSGSYKQIVNLRNQPMPFNIINFTNIATPFLSTMNCEILETVGKPGFITSDNPCLIFDPAVYASPTPRDWLSLFASPTFEAIFPLSPKQTISLKPNGFNTYRSITNPDVVNEINRLIVQNADEYVVSNQKEFRNYWFE